MTFEEWWKKHCEGWGWENRFMLKAGWDAAINNGTQSAHNSTMAEIADTICGFYSTNPRLSKFDIETLSRIEQQLRQ